MMARSTSSRIIIETPQNRPIAIWVARQPWVCVPQLTIGGQTAPAT